MKEASLAVGGLRKMTDRRGTQAWHSLGREAIAALRSLPPMARTTHFALHHARGGPLVPVLSTGSAPTKTDSVDNITSANAPAGLGMIAPKRLARRAATRNLIKRQVRAAVDRHGLPQGQWLVRLHRAFDPRVYPSAASTALRASVRFELEELLRGTSVADIS
jgi:ribonuclease P protein component